MARPEDAPTLRPSRSEPEGAPTRRQAPSIAEVAPTVKSGTAGESTPPSTTPGSQVGRYVVLGPLGTGAMGVVVSAYDATLDRRVALKLIRPPFSAEAHRARVMREAHAMARVSHPNVLAIYDVGLYPGGIYMAMELVEGGATLHDWLTQAPRSPAEALRMFTFAGRGLAAAHAAGLIHRDFKAANVLVATDGRVRVTDFGLARLASDVEGESGPVYASPAAEPSSLSTPLTMVGELMGTMQYMPPEQIKGGAVDRRTDQYAFCAALHEALYGSLPYNVEALVSFAARGGPRPQPEPPQKQPGVPARIREALLKGASLDPSQRFDELSELLRRLDWNPQTTRRRWLVGLTIAGSLGVAAAGIGLTWSQRVRSCAGGDELVAEAWGPLRAAAAERAFQATSLPFAQSAWTQARPLLDSYAAAWTASHRRTCEATRLRGVQTEATLGLQLDCLERARKQLGALATLFSEADRAVVERSVQAVNALPELETCANVRTLLLSKPLPSEPASRTELARLRGELAATQALFDTGRYAAALEKLEPLAARTEALSHEPTSAEAQQLLGRVHYALGATEVAANRLSRAAVLAERGGAEEVKLRALTEMSTLLANLGRFGEAHLALDLAEAGLARRGEEDGLVVEWEAAMGWVRSQEGKPAEAMPHYHRALALGEKVHYGFRLARIYSRAGFAAAAAGKTDEGLALLAQADERVQSVMGKGHPLRVTVLLNTTAALMMAKRYEESVTVAQSALELASRALAKPTADVATLYANLGGAYESLGRPEEFLEAERQATAVAEQLGDLRVRGLARENAAHALNLLRRFPEAVTEATLALQDFEATLPADHDYVAGALWARGTALLESGRAAAALADLERALTIVEPRGDQSWRSAADLAHVRFLTARALWDAGVRTARVRGLAEAALKHHEGTAEAPKKAEVEQWLSPKRRALPAKPGP